MRIKPNLTKLVGINFFIFYFNIRGKLDIIRFMISVWLRAGYNPADINRFRSHTGKYMHKNVYFAKIKD